MKNGRVKHRVQVIQHDHPLLQWFKLIVPKTVRLFDLGYAEHLCFNFYALLRSKFVPFLETTACYQILRASIIFFTVGYIIFADGRCQKCLFELCTVN